MRYYPQRIEQVSVSIIAYGSVTALGGSKNDGSPRPNSQMQEERCLLERVGPVCHQDARITVSYSGSCGAGNIKPIGRTYFTTGDAQHLIDMQGS
jgi:hypothetical protein